MSYSRLKFAERAESDAKKQTYDDLLVFGYQCKLFRDDDKALMIDNFLLPWNGDSSLMIDRHDGRGHLTDLKEYDSKHYHDDDDDDNNISTDLEKAEEEECNKERYYDLNNDVSEKIIYEEEEIKRMENEISKSNGYKEVSFSYDSEKNIPTTDEDNSEEEDQDFIKPVNLEIPDNIIQPKKYKHHKIIEKTAKFVAEHGASMEIMIKTKQQHNPRFYFINPSDELFPYYQFLIKIMKQGRYIYMEQNESSDEDDSGYLHPLLAPKKVEKTTEKLNLPQFNLNDTPYAKLLHSFGMKFNKDEEKESQAIEDSDVNLPNKTMDVDESLKLPPKTVQIVVDKLAEYVVKNGPHFEVSVRKKNEDRFAFLNIDHPYHAYYIFKRNYHLENNEKDPILYDEELQNILLKEIPKNTEFEIVEKPIHQSSESIPVLPLPPPPPPPPPENPEIIERNAKLQAAKEKVLEKLQKVAKEKAEELRIKEERKRKAAIFSKLVKTGRLPVTTDHSDDEDSIDPPSPEIKRSKSSSPHIKNSYH